MWVALVLGCSEEYMSRRTCLSCKAVNSKKLICGPSSRSRGSYQSVETRGAECGIGIGDGYDAVSDLSGNIGQL